MLLMYSLILDSQIVVSLISGSLYLVLVLKEMYLWFWIVEFFARKLRAQGGMHVFERHFICKVSWLFALKVMCVNEALTADRASLIHRM